MRSPARLARGVREPAIGVVPRGGRGAGAGVEPVTGVDMMRLRVLVHALTNYLTPIIGVVDLLAAEVPAGASPVQEAWLQAAQTRSTHAQDALEEISAILHGRG